jgi:hypothetical protein
MPNVKQIQDAKKKLRPTTRSKGNEPKLPNRLTYIIIAADPQVKRDRQFLKSVAEYMKDR